ncbi:MAG TPA: ABC transporter permease [Planctomycetota bacterium]|nr:ABC transporter permease [Planctomycetota bacterium]
MKKTWGVLGILVFVVVLTAILNPRFLGGPNIQNMLRWSSLYAIISIGAAFVIITGGVDLSIGSVVGLSGTLLALLLEKGMAAPLAIAVVLVLSVAIGVGHGLLVTKVRLQPFIVTLCGLLIYRGVARVISDDQSQGFGNTHEGLRLLANGKPFGIPAPFLIMAGIAAVAAIALNRTVWGRYLFALGRNEQAARYSGIDTHRITLMAYVLCALLSGWGGILMALDLNSIQPALFGNFYELYAIAAAVLGGCSLRGGEGSILGVVIGSAVMRVLNNAINLLGIPNTWEFVIIGLVLLGGVIADELVRRWAARRRAAREAGG